MNEDVKSLHKLCDVLAEELEEYSRKIEKADKMSAGDLEAVDKLSHALKSIKTTIAMMEAEDEDGYSNRGYMPYYGGMSYAGRMNAKRDNMGRYSREGRDYSRNHGYSYAEDMEATKDEMRELAQKMPEEHRRKIERALDDLR